MKKLFNICLVVLGIFIMYSCNADDSLPISQDQLLRTNKWKLKEVRTVKNNVTTTDGLLACERNSILDFTIVDQYTSTAYNTIGGNCVETRTEGSYIYNTVGLERRKLKLFSTTGDTINYYMNQLDPYFLVLQDTLVKTPTDSLTLRLHVYEPVK